MLRGCEVPANRDGSQVIDLRPVRSSRIRKSVGGERTFSRDLSSGSELRETMEDIIETLIGRPILDETDEIPNMRRLARRLWEHRLKAAG